MNLYKKRNTVRFKFSWQKVYGAFSYSHPNLDNVIAYIMKQKEHQHKKSLQEEYLEFLAKYQIEHKPEFLFDWL